MTELFAGMKPNESIAPENTAENPNLNPELAVHLEEALTNAPQTDPAPAIPFIPAPAPPLNPQMTAAVEAAKAINEELAAKGMAINIPTSFIEGELAPGEVPVYKLSAKQVDQLKAILRDSGADSSSQITALSRIREVVEV